MIDSIALSFRHSLQALRREPVFVALAALMLALGIASTTAIYTLIRGALLTPPPYEEPDRLVFISTASADDRDAGGLFNWPQQAWNEWLADTDSLESIAGYRWTFNFLVADDGSESLEGMMVSDEYFSVVGIEPEIGRAFSESDLDGTGNPVVVIGHDLWVRRFNADPGIIGRTIRISRQPPVTVIGVMPPDVRFLPSPGVASEPNYDLHATVDFWVPIPTALRDRPAWNLVARLKPGLTPTEAEAEIDTLLAARAESRPELEGLGARIDSLTAVVNAEGERLLVPLLAAAVLVLLIGCGNATALLLIRGLQRQHEYGLRSAIGAGRVRIFGLVITESLLLAGLSGIIGVAVSFGLVGLFNAASGSAIPGLRHVAIGWPVLVFGLGVAVVACVLAGLVPAVRAAHLNPVQALSVGGPKSSDGRGQRRLLAGVVVGQTALTLALLVGAGLLIRTVYNLDLVQAGYATRNVLTMSVTAVEGEWKDFHTRALERVSALPGVAAAAFAWGVPLTGNAWPSRIEIDGYVGDSGDTFVSLPLRAVTSGYFDILGQPLTSGRDFRTTDDPDAPPVAIVNEQFVQRYFPGGNAIGRSLWPRGRDNSSATRIIGVVGNSRTNDLTRPAEPEVYLPLWQAQAFSKHLVVRSLGSPDGVAASVRAALRDVAPTVAIENVQTLDEIRGASLASRNFAMKLLAGFAAVACALTLGGIYSVLSLSAVERRREIAIRSALGADRARILKLVMRQGLRMILSGTAVGIVASMAVASLLRAWLYGVGTTDPLTILTATALLVAVALLACWAPAWRAAGTEPAEALKSE